MLGTVETSAESLTSRVGGWSSGQRLLVEESVSLLPVWLGARSSA